MDTCLGDRKLGMTAMPPRSMVWMAESGNSEREEVKMTNDCISIVVVAMIAATL